MIYIAAKLVYIIASLLALLRRCLRCVSLFALGHTARDTCTALDKEGCLCEVVNESGRMRVQTASGTVAALLLLLLSCCCWIGGVGVAPSSSSLPALACATWHQVLTDQYLLGGVVACAGSGRAGRYRGTLQAWGLRCGSVLEELLDHCVGMVTTVLLFL